MMIKNKRDTRQQRLLASVMEENKMLREKIKSLERDVEIENEKINKCYEKALKKYDECEKTRIRYLALVKETEGLKALLKYEIESIGFNI